VAVPRVPGMNASGDSPPLRTAGAADASPPFRFDDNRQKYLAFVTSCNEKAAIARRAAHGVTLLRPTPPAVRVFDAGIGDGTVIGRVMRSTHRQFPTVPMTTAHEYAQQIEELSAMRELCWARMSRRSTF
jgi:hypothetical protein